MLGREITAQEVYLLYRNILQMLEHLNEKINYLRAVGDQERLNAVLKLKRELEEAYKALRENVDYVLERSI